MVKFIWITNVFVSLSMSACKQIKWTLKIQIDQVLIDVRDSNVLSGTFNPLCGLSHNLSIRPFCYRLLRGPILSDKKAEILQLTSFLTKFHYLYLYPPPTCPPFSNSFYLGKNLCLDTFSGILSTTRFTRKITNILPL